MKVDKVLESLFVSEYDNLKRSISRFVGMDNLDEVEDLVQETFAVAASKWETDMPRQPAAWLFTTSRNLALNSYRRKKRLALSYSKLPFIENNPGKEINPLNLLFAVVQTSFPAKVQLVVALRYARSFPVNRIAALLATDEDSISKIIYRWREQVERFAWNFEDELTSYNKAHVQFVLKILYLMFTEGHRLSENGGLTDEGLCEDAVSLTMDIIKLDIDKSGEAKSLFALMQFHLARAGTRVDDTGSLIHLGEQDRRKWDKQMIAVATQYLKAARIQSVKLNSYLIEASIAFVHATASKLDQETWLIIGGLYRQLLHLNASPFVRLNHAFATYQAGLLHEAIHTLETLAQIKYFRKNALFYCFCGLVYSDRGMTPEARSAYSSALACTRSDLEKQWITNKIQSIGL